MTARSPLAYFWGDDDLSIDRAVARFARHVADGGEPLEPWRLRGNKNLADGQIAEIQSRIATPVLFGGGTLAVVSNAGALMVTTEGRDAVLALVGLTAPGNGLVIVEQARSGARGPGQLKLAKAIQDAGGVIREFPSPREGGLAAWIDSEARDRGMRLAPGAAKEIASRIGGFVREGDADRRDQTRRAAMELDKLALYRPDASITVDDVAALVAEAVPGSAWAFADAVGDRDGPRATALLETLAETMPEPVIVVVLHRRVREMLELKDRLPTAKNVGEAGRAMGINAAYRAQRIAEQGARWKAAELVAALDGILELDAVVKGAPGRGGEGAWHRLAFTLWIADHVGRSGVRRPPGVSARRSPAASAR